MPARQHAAAWVKSAAQAPWLPLLILVAPVVWCVYQSDKAERIVPMLPLPIIAFVVGLLLRPRHVWFSGSAAWSSNGSPCSRGTRMPNRDRGETRGSIIIEAFFWMASGVLVPVWCGRRLRAGFAADRRPNQPPATCAPE